jgi:hypothetical protein
MPREYGPQGLPSIPLPYEAVARHYGGQANEIMERFRSSRNKAAAEYPPESYKWTIEYERASDPPTDVPELFARILATNSKVYLVARGNKLKQWEELFATPPQVMARFEERARMVCDQRRHESAHPLEPTDLEVPEYKSDRLVDALDDWLKHHPKASKPLATIATIALELLVESGDG